MEIVSLNGSFEETLNIQNEVKRLNLTHKTKLSICPFAPSTQLQKWKIPKSGFYAPMDVSFVVHPHLSERAGVMAVVKLVDSRDSGPSRILYKSASFNLGHGLTVEGSQLPFCLPVGEYPLQFEVMVSQSQFKETASIFSTSLDWRMLFSNTPLSRVKSVMGAAHTPAQVIEPNFKMQIKSSRGGRQIDSKTRMSRGQNGPSTRRHSPTSVGGSSDVSPQFAQDWEGESM